MGPPIVVQSPDACPPVWEIKNLRGMEKKKFDSKEEAEKCLDRCRKAYKAAMKERKDDKPSEAWRETYCTGSASNSKPTEGKVQSSLVEKFNKFRPRGVKGVIGKDGMLINRKGIPIPTTEIYAHGFCLDGGRLSDGTLNIACGIGVYMEPQHKVTTLQTVSEPMDGNRPSPPKAAYRAAYLALEMAAKSGCKLIQVKMSNTHTLMSLMVWNKKWGGIKNVKVPVPEKAIIVNREELERIATKRNELLEQGIKIWWLFVDENDQKNKLAMSLARAGAQEKLNVQAKH